MRISEIVGDIKKKRQIDSVYLIGCGGSLATYYPAKYLLETESKTLKIAAYTSNEFVHATPKACGEHSIAVACSLRGTPETVEAMRVARACGAATIAYTGDVSLVGDPERALMRAGEYSVTYRSSNGNDGISNTESNMSQLMELAFEILHQFEGYKYYPQAMKGFADLNMVIEKATKFSADAQKAFAKRYGKEEIIYVLSSGSSFGTAYAFSICSLMEIQWIHSPTIHSGEYFHGPFETTSKELPVVLLKNDGPTRPLDERAERFLKEHGGNHTVIDAKDLSTDLFAPEIRDYFNGIVFSLVLSGYLNTLADERMHARSVRRYMWQVAY